MNKSIIALLLLTSASAFANGPADEQMNRATFTGERARAEVKAELRQAQGQGVVGSHSGYAMHLQQPSFKPSRSKADVRAEAVQAARSRVVHESI
jgi:hypothetical protein